MEVAEEEKRSHAHCAQARTKPEVKEEEEYGKVAPVVKMETKVKEEQASGDPRFKMNFVCRCCNISRGTRTRLRNHQKWSARRRRQVKIKQEEEEEEEYGEVLPVVKVETMVKEEDAEAATLAIMEVTDEVNEERVEQEGGGGDLQLEEENRRLKRKVEELLKLLELEEEVMVLKRRKVEELKEEVKVLQR